MAATATLILCWSTIAHAASEGTPPGDALPSLPVVIDPAALMAMNRGVLALAGDQAWHLATGADSWQVQQWEDEPVPPPVASAGGNGVAWMVVPPRAPRQRGVLEEVRLRDGLLKRRRSLPLPQALGHIQVAADARLVAIAGVDGLRRLRMYLLPVNGGSSDWLALSAPQNDPSVLPAGLAWMNDGLYLTLLGEHSAALWRWTLARGWQQRAAPAGVLAPGSLQIGRPRRLLALLQGPQGGGLEYDPVHDRWSRVDLPTIPPGAATVSNGNQLTISSSEGGRTRMLQWHLSPPSTPRTVSSTLPALAGLFAGLLLTRRYWRHRRPMVPSATSPTSIAPAGLAALLVCALAASDVRLATYEGGWPSLGLLLVATMLSIALLLTSTLLIPHARAWLSTLMAKEKERSLLRRTQLALRLLLELGVRLPLLILIPAHGLAWLSGYPLTSCILAQAAIASAIMALSLWRPALRHIAVAVTGALLLAVATALPPPVTSMPLLASRGGPWELAPLQLAAWCGAVLLLPMAIRFRDPRCTAPPTWMDASSSTSHLWALTMIGLLIMLVCTPLLAALQVFHQHEGHLAGISHVLPSVLALAMPVAWPPTAAGAIVGGLMVLSLMPLLDDMRGLRMRRRLGSITRALRGRTRRLLEAVPLALATAVALAVADTDIDLLQDAALYLCVVGIGVVGLTALAVHLGRS